MKEHKIEFMGQKFVYWFERETSRPRWVWTSLCRHGYAMELHQCDSDKECLLSIGSYAERNYRDK